MVDVNSLLASAKLPETTVDLCLDGPLAAECETAREALAKAEVAPRDSLGAGGEVQGLRDQLEVLRERAKAATVTFRLRAVGRKRWTQLLAEHPPRKDVSRDLMVSANEDTLSEALIREGLVDPELSSEQLDLLLDEHLSEGQYNELANAAYFVNRRSVSVPFS